MNDRHKQPNALFQSFLKEKKLSSTTQREIILEEVYSTHVHFNVEDILFNLRRKKKSVSRATVYRTLKYLEESNLIRKIDLGQEHAYYEHIHGHSHHEHLYCRHCGKIIEIEDPELEKRIETIAAHNNFLMKEHTVQIFGICDQCQKQ